MNDASVPGASRRQFLRRAALAGSGLAVAPALLAACNVKSVDSTSAGGGAGSATALGGNAAYKSAITKLVGGRTVRVGWTPPVLSEFFNQMESAAFRRMADYESAYGVKWIWERASPTGNFNAVEQQVQIVQSWAQRKFDVILVCTGANFATMQNVYRQASAKGSKVYQFNQPVEIFPQDKLAAISSIGYDNRWQSGYLCGSYIAGQLKGKGKVLEITGPPGSDWSTARQIGFRKALAEHPGLRVAGTANGGYLRDQGQSATQDLLTRNKDVNAIWGENEDMALGASQALDDRGIKQWDGSKGVVVIGADGLVSGMEAIRAGKLTASVDVGSVDQGTTFVDTVFHNAVLGEAVGKVIDVPTRVVDKHNVDAAEAYMQWALATPKKY
ncbi:sugar ABC transporter substrate-binding protein [uncultured Jatrophihabitans sp.]|uniref:sugar ABC transporter substrate-binding protein n=1 Tax=uncultured Jatrophihabitans sp. TaxID=1610747 RepID=UPI0035C96137